MSLKEFLNFQEICRLSKLLEATELKFFADRMIIKLFV